MACSIDQIKRDGLNKVKGMIKGKAKSIVFNEDNVATFQTSGKKIQNKTQSLRVAQKKQKAIEDWSDKTFGKGYGSWTNLLDSNGVIKLEVKFPPRLLKAYEQKIERENNVAAKLDEMIEANEYLYGGQVYATLEDMQVAMEQDTDLMPRSVGPYNPTNFADYINAKKILQKKVNTRLATLLARRKYEANKEIKEEIIQVRKISESLEKDIHELTNAPDIFEHTMATFNKDIDMIETLLEGDRPLIEDIHTAEFMIAYFKGIADYSSANTRNSFVNTKEHKKIEPEIKDVLDTLGNKLKNMDSLVNEAKQNYLLELIDNSPNLKSIFPNQQIEEIRDHILKDQSDIGLVSEFFGTVDKQFTAQDSLLGQLIRLELDRSRNVSKGYAAKQVSKLDDVVPRVKRILLNRGQGISWKPLNSLFSEVSYDMFYQKTSDGNRTGRMIGPFSDTWYKALGNFFKSHNEKVTDHYLNGEWEELNKTLAKKYDWLNENTEFMNISRLSEISSHPKFTGLTSYMKPADATYRQEIIDMIGQHTYDKLIEEQIEKLEDWMDTSKDEIDTVLASHNVQTIAELEAADVNALRSLNITLLRNNPFQFMDSHNSGQKGKVDYVEGNSSNQYQSHLKYNTFFPKKSVERVNFNTGQRSQIDYHEQSFEEIKNEPALLEFWEIMNDSLTFMNMTLNDSSKTLMHNSLPSMKKFATDILLDKNMDIAAKYSTLLTRTKETVRAMFSTNLRGIDPNDVDSINKSAIRHVQDDVNLKFKTELLRRQRTEGRKLTIDEKKLLREEITNQVMLEQSFNLPVMIRAYMDMVAEYKAQKDSLPKLSIFKSLYENIKKKKRESFDPITNLSDNIMSNMRVGGIQDLRVRANNRMNYWFNKNVMNMEEKVYWVKFGKFYNEDEQKYLDEIKQEEIRLNKEIDTLAKDPNADVDEMLALEEELAQVENSVEMLGRDYNLAAAYNTVVNKFRIFTGLAWNIPSNITNRFQGLYAGLINDNGKYWKAGNFYVANGFTMKKALRYVPGRSQYKNEIRKARLFMDRLNIIQDATNEIDRARNVSGFTGTVKKLSPFYITEYTEWHNQTPQILAMLMDETILSTTGEAVPIFDGETFPAFRINDAGQLSLRPEYATQENIDTWEAFSNEKSSNIKARLSDTISILNGDYSRTGSTYIKNFPFGKTLMTFKTWLPNQIWQRFAYNQKNLALGKERYDGVYTGAYISPKTSSAATAVLVTGFATAGIMGLGIATGGALALAAIAGNMYINSKAGGEEINVASQLAGVAKGIVKKMIGLPVNLVSGKNLIKAHTFNELNITEAEKQHLQTLITEISVLLGLTLAKIILKSMYGPNDDDEPKTLDGKTPNPYYGKNLRTEEEKQFYNLMENQLTKMISDTGMYTNPDALHKTMVTTSLMSWLDNVEKLNKAINSMAQGKDRLTTGANQGESRTLNQLGKMFLPSLFKGKLGFENMMEQEYVKDENVDSWFHSDYKKDRQVKRADRSYDRERLTQYWQEQFDYDNRDERTKLELDAIIKKKVAEHIKHVDPYPARIKYDAEQNKR